MKNLLCAFVVLALFVFIDKTGQVCPGASYDYDFTQVLIPSCKRDNIGSILGLNFMTDFHRLITTLGFGIRIRESNYGTWRKAIEINMKRDLWNGDSYFGISFLVGKIK